MSLHFNAKTEIVVSENLSETLSKLVEQQGAGKVVFLIDACMDMTAALASFREAWNAIGISSREILFQAVEPTTDLVDEYAAKLAEDVPDLLIGIGGGSTLDLAKAISAIAVLDGSVTDYHGTGKPVTKAIRKVMVPTTAGTGSEVTPGAVLVNPHTEFKRALGGPLVCPDYAVLFAPFTASMPTSVTVATGMDAIAHAVESYTAKNANQVTRMYSKQAFNILIDALPKVLAEPQDLEHRNQMLLGSCLAGFAIYNSNTGACHSMAYPLGIYHGVPHGVAVALMLPRVVQINVERGCELYSELNHLWSGRECFNDCSESAQAFASDLMAYGPLQLLEASFERYGIDHDRIDFLAERGLDLVPALSNNPVDFGKEDALRVLSDLVD